MTQKDQRIKRQIEAEIAWQEPSQSMTDFMHNVMSKPEFKEVLSALHKDGVRGMGSFFAKSRRTALASAQQGDMAELSGLMREGAELNEGEREFVADLLIGAVPNRRGAPPKSELTRRVTLAHFWLTEIDSDKCEAALSELQKMFGMARSTVSKHLRSGRNCVVTQEKIADYRVLRKLEYWTFLYHFRGIDLKSE